MAIFENIPYTNLHNLNLDFIIKNMIDLDAKVEELAVKENLIFPDPITWNITTQYLKNSVVIDNDVAYIAKQAVPANIDISNRDYWLPIFDLTTVFNDLKHSITATVETGTTASQNYSIGDVIYLNNDLKLVIKSIAAGELFTASNIYDITVIEYIRKFKKYNVLNYGAVGDGVTDDTAAIQAAFAAAASDLASDDYFFDLTSDIARGYEIYFPAGHYVITSELVIPALFYEASGLTNRRTAAARIHGDSKASTILDFSGALSGNGISVQGNTVEIDHLRIHNAKNNAINCGSVPSWNNHFHDLEITNSANYAIQFDTAAFNTLLEQIHMYNCSGGIKFDAFITSVNVNNCYIASSAAEYGYYVSDNGAVYSQFDTCACDGLLHAYYIGSGSQISLNNCGNESQQGSAILIGSNCNIEINNHFDYNHAGAFIVVQGLNNNIKINKAVVRNGNVANTSVVVNWYSDTLTNDFTNNIVLEDCETPTNRIAIASALNGSIYTHGGAEIILDASGAAQLGIFKTYRGTNWTSGVINMVFDNLSTGDSGSYIAIVSTSSNVIKAFGADTGSNTAPVFTFTISGNTITITHVNGSAAAGARFRVAYESFGDLKKH